MWSSGKKKAPAIFRVVCIGGSAGSLTAYLDILRQIPTKPGVAIVIVSHRSRSRADRLVQILARATRLSVVEVTDGMRLQPNLVFVAPAYREITTDGVALRLAGQTGYNGWPTVISDFLFSLASACTVRAIAIIVSGTGHDGSAGLVAVKRAGGRTFAQSDALFPDMPEAAIGTEHVDFISTAEAIGKYLASPRFMVHGRY